MDSLKTWLIEVGFKKIAPSLITGALAALVGLLTAHKGILSSMGITYDPSGNTIDLHLNTLAGYLVVAGTGLLTAFFTAAQHHTVAAVTNAPQDGDQRQIPTDPTVGGSRKEDPKP